MGKPIQVTGYLSAEFIGGKKRTYRTETSHVGIGKDINRDFPSSGERTGNSLNRRVKPSGLQGLNKEASTLDEVGWKAPP
jgi:hypothetical protein